MTINDKILNTLFLNLSEGIIFTDENHSISLITPKVYDLIKVKNHKDLQTENDLLFTIKKISVKPGIIFNIQNSLQENNTITTTNIIELSNGIHIDLSSCPVIDKKEFKGRIWLLSDITESIIMAKKIDDYVNQIKLNEDRMNRKAFDLFQLNSQLKKSKEKLKEINENKDK